MGLDDRLDRRVLVARPDQEVRRVAPHLLVDAGRHRDALGARRIAALAEDVERAGDRGERLVHALDALVDLAEHDLVEAEPTLSLVHVREPTPAPTRHVRCLAPDVSFRDLWALEAAGDDQLAACGLDLDPRARVDGREARPATLDLRRAEPVDACRADLRAVHEEADPRAREPPHVLDLDLELTLALVLELRLALGARERRRTL